MLSTSGRKLPVEAEPLAFTSMDTPVGRLLLAGDDGGLRFVNYVGGESGMKPGAAWQESEITFHEAVRQLTAYFNRELRIFDLPLQLFGTPFQLAVWNMLRRIPYGETMSYGELARRIGNPAAVRAVGGANHANPIAIIVPCHRVIGAHGNLVGYGGGLANKDRLLALERGELFPFSNGQATASFPG